MNRILLTVAVVVSGLSGCASPARYVEKSGDVGVIAIPANTDAWPTHYRSEAFALIERHVGPNFEIVEEKEVPVGTRTNNNQQVKREQTFNSTMPFLPAEKDTVTNTTSTHDITEWRIAYRRKVVANPAVGDINHLGQAGGLTPYTAPQVSVTQSPSTPSTGGVTQTPPVPAGGAAGVQPAGALVPGVGPTVGPTSAAGLSTSMTSGSGGATCPK
jgi:hypothetical protein